MYGYMDLYIMYGARTFVILEAPTVASPLKPPETT